MFVPINSSQKRLLAIGLMVTATSLSGCFGGDVPVKAAETLETTAENTKAQLNGKIREAGNFSEKKYGIASWMELRDTYFMRTSPL